jgi:hypothetical protein
VTCAVGPAAFDDSAFHDLISRARHGAFRAGQVVRGLRGLAQAASGIVASVVALALLEPLLLPVCGAAALPALWLARRRARSYYGFAFRVTQRDRERVYLASLLSERRGGRARTATSSRCPTATAHVSVPCSRAASISPSGTTPARSRRRAATTSS